jgi:hypothetical protein
MRVARSRRGEYCVSSGVSSTKVVCALPAANVGCKSTFSRKARLVFTPLMRNSRIERTAFRRA